ncbi:TIGR03083 family protein [Nocardioides alpinus]|uniref:Maleylpyruvate isomerase family mycothiol-dependent enzyme n=1 Tax=Nocardioides alpinus TaxID=748909 RepID=A0A1I0ZZR0_9ACTN|nr:maleylpyruvate isomerase family mycothiol-dependent enzyme [Nocardioides alpinus]PKH42220.1 maleylpyruvate isomerase family mycothiol-dependent enzyme [Nocardioides alpinus]SFB31121.1 TIGR03083 family protein [Nocardioides alpinus]
MTDVWPLVHVERHALIADLEGLTDQQWCTPSLCDGWTVHDVAAHLVGNAGPMTIPGLVLAMARARFDFDRMNQADAARELGDGPAYTLRRLREVADNTDAPPFVPLVVRLVEEVVHGEDVRRPLGIAHDYPLAAVVPALEHQVRTTASIGGGRERAAGVRLRATDADVSIGEGPEVSGPAVSLLLAVSGRSEARADLAGPGLFALG